MESWHRRAQIQQICNRGEAGSLCNAGGVVKALCRGFARVPNPYNAVEGVSFQILSWRV